MRLLLDFLAAVGSLFHLVGGYSLGKWQSEKSVVDNFAGEQYEQGSDQGKLSGPPFEEMKAGAKRSKWIGITCVAVGTVLFVVRLMV